MNESGLFTTPYVDRSVADCFSDESWMRTLVQVEVALARAQARAGVIPTASSEEIAKRAAQFICDRAALTVAIERDGFPILGLVTQLRRHIGGDAARYLHWGATTQDIVDTALVLQLWRALDLIDSRLTELLSALAHLADQHRNTLMTGRTHLQPALPTTFGLKAAGWLAPLVRHRRALAELRTRALNVQLGGAAGTLAALGRNGLEVTEAFAGELGLGVLPMPWHAQRDPLLEIAYCLTLIANSTAKFAHDILLLAQHEIGEVQESATTGRGGSSAMPQKRNPIRSEAILVAARTASSEAQALTLGIPPEHERGTQVCQTELLHFPRVCAFTGGALGAALKLAQELVVDEARMTANLRATHGVLLAEAASLALARVLEPAVARDLVQQACATAVAEKRHLLDVLGARPEVRPALASLPKSEADYLGSDSAFIDRVLADAASGPRRIPSALFA